MISYYLFLASGKNLCDYFVYTCNARDILSREFIISRKHNRMKAHFLHVLYGCYAVFLYCICDGNDSNMFVTLFVGEIELATGKFTFCNAGHNPIVVKSPDGNARFLHSRANLAIGLVDEFEFKKEVLQLEKGTRLILYTDGVTEAEDIDKNQYGEERLLEFVRNIPENDSSEDVINNLFSSVKVFTGENEQNDDITVLTVRL